MSLCLTKYLVIKTVSYFPNQCALNSKPVLAAVLSSLKNCHVEIKSNDWNCDAVVIWSVLWQGRMKSNQKVYEHYRAAGRPVIIVEIGTLKRGLLWKISVNNINAHGFYGHQHNLNLDRPKQLGMILGSVGKSKYSSILIAAQHTNSLQIQGVDQQQWLLSIIETVKQHSDRSIVIRPHPRSKLNLDQLPRNCSWQQPRPVPFTYDNFDIEFDYHAVINYNSGPGILAALAGTRPLVHGSSLASVVSINPCDIEKSYDIDRFQWFVEICHTEYTVEEIAQGLWLDRLDYVLSIKS